MSSCSCYGLTLWLTLLVTGLNAQVKTNQQKLDSVLQVDRNHPQEDSMKVVIFRAVQLQYLRVRNIDKANEYLQKVITLSRKLNLPKLEALAYVRHALYYHGNSKYLGAVEYYEKAVKVYHTMKDSDGEAGIYLNMGALYAGIPDYEKAIVVNQKAIDIFLKNGNEEDLASCYVNLANVYQDLGLQSNALTYLQKAMKIFVKAGENSRGVAVASLDMGNTYYTADTDDFAEMGLSYGQKNQLALESFLKGLKIAEIIDDYGLIGSAHNSLGELYMAMGNTELALKSYQKALDINKDQDDKANYATSLIALANYAQKEKNYTLSNEYLSKALVVVNENDLLREKRAVYFALSTNEEKLGNFNQSLIYYRQYISIRDQIFKQEKEKEITTKQLQLDFAVKEKDYQLRQELTDSRLKQQVLLAKQQQQQLAIRQQQLALSDKEKSLQRLTFLKKQADLENEKRLQASIFSQQQMKSDFDKRIKDKQISLQNSELRFNKNVNIVLSLLAIVLFGLGVFVFFTQRKTAKLNRLVLDQKQELERLGKVKDRIFSVVSHDMRAPVNSLISFIQLLEGGDISKEKLTKYAGHLKNTLGYTSAMMENLLNWASSQMQGFNPVIEKFDAQLCTQEVIDSMLAIASQKNITINNAINSGMLCLADMNMCSLVLRNIISNAIKFTPNNGTINVDAHVQQHELMIMVSDTGVGLSVQQVDAFNQESFHDLGKTTAGTNKEKGTGIGLVLCKTFITLMNGSLKVKSELNKGSIFTVSLPKAA